MDAAHEPTAEQRPRVLAIDDVEDNLLLLATGLGARGFDVITAAGGADGLRVAAEAPPDLVLLDLAMPEVDGFAVLASLRASPRTAEVPVIFLTATGRDSFMIEQGFAAGADDYVVKPLAMEELAIRIRQVLARQARLARRANATLAEVHSRLGALRQALQEVREAGAMPMAQWAEFNRALALLEEVERDVGARLGAPRARIEAAEWSAETHGP